MDATLVFDAAGELIFANEEAEVLLGQTGDGLLGSSLDSLGDFLRSPGGKQWGANDLPFRRVLESGEGLPRWEAAALTRYGELRQIVCNIAPIRRDAGIGGLVVTAQSLGLAPKIVHENADVEAPEALEDGLALRNLERSLRLQEALLDLSKSKAKDLDQIMERLTSVDGEILHVDRVGIWLFDQDRSVLALKKLYSRKNQRFIAEQTQILKADFPRYFSAIHQKRILATSDAQVDPRTSELTASYLAPKEIRSMMDVPIWKAGKVVGIVCHENVGKVRKWAIHERQFATSIAEMMALALETQERIKAELASRKSEERLRLLTEQLPALVWTTDIDLKISSVMGSGLIPLNLKPNQVEGDMYELFQARMPLHPLNVPQQKALKGESVTFDGDWQGRNYQIHIEPFRDLEATIIGTIGVAVDTTDRRRAEEESRLIQSLTLSMVGVESVDEALGIALEKICLTTSWSLGQAWVPDETGETLVLCKHWFSGDPVFKDFNEASAKIRITPGEGLPGRVWSTQKLEWHMDITAEGVVAERNEIAGTLGLKSGIAFPILEGDEVLAVIEFFRTERTLPDERLVNLIAAITMQLGTIIQRKRVESERKKLLDLTQALVEAAKRRAAELEAVVSSIADGVLVMDMNSRLVLANRPALAMFGLEKLSGEAPRWESIVEKMRVKNDNGEVLPFDELPMSLALRGKKVVEQTLCWADPKTGRDRYVRVTAAPVEAFDGKGPGAVSIARDITEQRDFLQMKDQFIRVTAHELKTPLSIMKGYSEMVLRQGAELPEQVQKMLVAIDRGADRIVRIVNDLLEISKFGKLEMPVASPEKINLAPFIAEAVERNALDSTLHRINMGKMDDVWVQGDRGRLEQVLNNLLQNARKYSPEGGEITVSVIKNEVKATVCVKDQGIGIPLDKQQHIFQQFYRAHSDTPYNYGGMGVGLYISREIIRRHGGEMFFESEPGKGSSFCFSLPAIGAHSAGADS